LSVNINCSNLEPLVVYETLHHLQLFHPNNLWLPRHLVESLPLGDLLSASWIWVSVDFNSSDILFLLLPNPPVQRVRERQWRNDKNCAARAPLDALVRPRPYSFQALAFLNAFLNAASIRLSSQPIASLL
jgi:hypothetical protein